MNLCYLGTPQEYLEYRKFFPLVETIFLCPNLLSVLRLKHYNERVDLHDNHVPTDRAWAAQSWLSNLLQSWYLDAQGNDRSVSGNISLGRISHSLLGGMLVEEMRRALSITCAVVHYRPDVIAWGASLGQEWERALASLVPQLGIRLHSVQASGDNMAPPLERFQPIESYLAGYNRKQQTLRFSLRRWLTSAYMFLRENLGGSNARHRHEVLFLNDPTFEAVWDEWNSKPEARRSVRLGFLLTAPPSNKLLAIRAMLRGCTVYPVETRAKNGFENRDVGATVRDMEVLMEDDEWMARLTWDGVDLAQMLAPVLQRVVRCTFPMLGFRAISLERALLRHRPKAVIFPCLGPSNSQILWQLAPTYHYKTVYLPHGFPMTTRPEFHNILGETLAVDRVIVASEASRDIYTELGADLQKVVPIGFAPAQRAIEYARSHSFKKKPIEHESQVLCLDYVRVHELLSHKERIGEEYFFNVIELLTRLGYRRIVYKLKPSRDQLAYVQELRRYVRPSIEITVVQDAPIFDLMTQAQFVVGPVSTAVLEAAVLDTPYLCAHFDDFPLCPPMDTEEVPVAHDYDSLERLIQGHEDMWPKARRAILRDGCGLGHDVFQDNAGFGSKLFEDFSTWLGSPQASNQCHRGPLKVDR